MKKALAVALLALASWPALAQEKIIETIEVRILNVDVVVRDRAGKPVTGLTKDDFELWDNDRKQVVTNAYEVRPAVTKSGVVATLTASAPQAPAPVETTPAPPELRDRKIVLFIDNYSLPAQRRNQVLTAVQKFVDEKTRPDDQIMIVIWQHTPKILTQFTSDRKAIRDILTNLAKNADAGATSAHDAEMVRKTAQDLIDGAKEGKIGWSDAYRQAILNVDSYTEQITFDANHLLKALGDTAGALSGIEGRKAIVFAGAHLPEKPGIELYTYTFNRFQPYIRSLEVSSDAIMGRNNAVKFSIQNAAEKAASAGVTFYVIDAADLRDSISAEYSGDYSSDGTEHAMAYVNTAMAFNRLARMTGGVAMLAENFDAAFDTLSADFNSYYSIGYRPTDDTPGRKHTIVVKTKNPAYVARARETYKAKTVDEQLNDRVLANIVSDVHGDWKIEVASGPPRKDGDKYRVPVMLSLSPTLTLLPKDGKLAGGFTIYLAVGTADGRRSEVTKIPQKVEIAPEGEAQLRSKPITFGALVIMTPGTNLVSVAAVDQITNATGFARTSVVLE